jgi:sterol desaturase/sphingolipid hydroxylase (fatty acid hydroxylase superfamily)
VAARVTPIMATFLTSFAAGLFGWTLLEYAIHYWLGHLPKGRILISSEHLAHHRDILYFTPLRMKIRGAVPVLAALLLVVGGTCGLTAGLGFVAAVALGWTVYERLHQSIHVHGPRNAYSRWAARHHLSHHFGLPNANHGVTTPIWDVVFGTYVPVRRVQVAKRFQASVPWLAAADVAGREAPAFLADYERV